MHVDESALVDAVLAQQRIDARLRRCARDQRDLLVGGLRIDADTPQCVEIRLDRVARRALRQLVEMRERPLPQPLLARPLARDGEARPQQMRERHAARMLGQVDQ
jgi:hypothetical protein